MAARSLPSNILDLEWIRHELVRLEDSIIFALIDRSGLRQNLPTYEKGFFKRNDFQVSVTDADTGDLSFLEYFLRDTEKVHAKLRRYTSPDEYPFFPEDLPSPIIAPLEYESVLQTNNVNYNQKLLQQYIERIVPALCKEGDDGNYGSSATLDISVLQLLSRRIHFGKLVAEAKYRDPRWHDKYVEMIRERDCEGILTLLTNEKVEKKILKRLRQKSLLFGQEIDIEDDDQEEVNAEKKSRIVLKSNKIDQEKVAEIYAEVVIKLTKDIEVEYLLQRREGWLG